MFIGQKGVNLQGEYMEIPKLLQHMHMARNPRIYSSFPAKDEMPQPV
jgi:hypothetical protein